MFNVAFVIATEKVADTEEFSARSVEPLAGDVDDTVGGVVSMSALLLTGSVPPPHATIMTASAPSNRMVE